MLSPLKFRGLILSFLTRLAAAGADRLVKWQKVAHP